VTLVDDNDLEKSLREILPSEGHRKKVQNECVQDTPRQTGIATVGE